MKDTKADIVSEAIEAIDYHKEAHERLKEQQKVLLGLCGFLLLLNII